VRNNRNQSGLRDDSFITEAATGNKQWRQLEQSEPRTKHKKELMNFSQLGLAATQLRACESLGYTKPTPIQTKAIPVILSGLDLIGCA